MKREKNEVMGVIESFEETNFHDAPEERIGLEQIEYSELLTDLKQIQVKLESA